jgi:phage terminase large subunit-like protein
MGFKPGYRGFLEFAETVGLALEPFQRKIARASFDTRELVALLARGNGKSRLIATIVTHHLLTTEKPAVYVAAASRDQARVIFEYARDIALHPALEGLITVRHLELRVAGGFLRVLASDAPKLHGLTPTMVALDELQAFKDQEVYLALRTAMQKRPGARMVVISTAGQGAESPLGQLRSRALALPDIRTRGALADARGPSLRMLEWAVPEDAVITDMRAAKRANPASWITLEGLREQRDAVPELAYRRFHLNQWVGKIGSWLPAGAWQACAGEPTFGDGERIWIGVDVGGSRADSAVVWVNESLNVGVEIFTGEDAVLEVAAFVPELAERYQVVEAAADPWRAGQMARDWEQRGIRASVFPQHDGRMIPASQTLYDAITEVRLVHPDHPQLNAHVGAAVAKHSRRGWRIDRAAPGENIDGAVALAIACSRALEPQPETKLIGWLGPDGFEPADAA